MLQKKLIKLMSVRSLEEDFQGVMEQQLDMDALNDSLRRKLKNLDVYRTKMNKCVREYELNELNPSRENKRLLVLDIDYTLFDDYDIVMWIEKIRLLGMNTSNYKIWFYLDSAAMMTVHCPKREIVLVKPLGVIWGNYSLYSSKNTIMFDDIRRLSHEPHVRSPYSTFRKDCSS